MEAFLLTLDVLFMVLLVLAVARRDKKTKPAKDLGLFSYVEGDPTAEHKRQGKTSA